MHLQQPNFQTMLIVYRYKIYANRPKFQTNDNNSNSNMKDMTKNTKKNVGMQKIECNNDMEIRIYAINKQPNIFCPTTVCSIIFLGNVLADIFLVISHRTSCCCRRRRRHKHLFV